MALVGSRVELDADEVRRQAERAGPGTGGCGRMRSPAGSRLARRVSRAVLHAEERPTGPGRAAGARQSLFGPHGLLRSRSGPDCRFLGKFREVSAGRVG